MVRVARPQSALHHYLPDNAGVPIKFGELDVRAFAYGELTILSFLEPLSTKYLGRLDLLLQILAAAKNYTWQRCLDFYSRVIRRIELNKADWDSITLPKTVPSLSSITFWPCQHPARAPHLRVNQKVGGSVEATLERVVTLSCGAWSFNTTGANYLSPTNSYWAKKWSQ